jgi:hypothetical protein
MGEAVRSAAERKREAEKRAAIPRRHKTLDEMTPGDHLDHQRTGQRPETDEYRAYKRQVLEDAGLDVDREDKTEDEWDVEDHLAHVHQDVPLGSGTSVPPAARRERKAA